MGSWFWYAEEHEVWEIIWSPRLIYRTFCWWTVSKASFETISKGSIGLQFYQFSLSTGFQVYLSKCWVFVCESRLYDTTSFLLFLIWLVFCCLIIVSPPLLGLGFKSIYLSPGFCLCRPRQYNSICWELHLFSGFFVSSLMIVWADGVIGSALCLAGGRGCWLMGPHKIPITSWIYHRLVHFQIH